MVQAANQRIPATLIPPGGIGPEFVEVAAEILDALGAPFVWDEQQGGLAGIEATGDPLPSATLGSIRRTKLALKGPLPTPVGGGFRPVNVRLPEEFGLYANVRPVHTIIPGQRYENIDIVLVRRPRTHDSPVPPDPSRPYQQPGNRAWPLNDELDGADGDCLRERDWQHSTPLGFIVDDRRRSTDLRCSPSLNRSALLAR